MGSALPPVIFIMGPTASGKTDLAVDLAQKLPVDLISVDSALVYRGMDIGTAKPEPEVLAKAPHRLIDICDPEDAYSAAHFCKDALLEMAQITDAGRIPLLVGGTMLYYRALQYGLSELPESQPEIRQSLTEEMTEQGLSALHQRLAQVDPVAAARIHSNDPQRIMRALEVWQITGKSLTQLHKEQAKHGMPYRAIKLIRAPVDRKVLHQRIERRFVQMLEQGFEQEVRDLMQRPGMKPELPSMRSVGYRQMLAYLNGEYAREEMIHKGIVATRQLAKRQFTWLRKEKNVHWLEENSQKILHQALKIIKSELSSG